MNDTAYDIGEANTINAADSSDKSPPSHGMSPGTAVAILDNISDAVFVLDAEWRFTYLNSVFEQWTHRTRVELLGRLFWDEFPETDETSFRQASREAMRELTPVIIEGYYPFLNSWCAIRIYPLQTNSFSGLSIYLRDITAEQEARQERTRLLTELEQAKTKQVDSLYQSEERFRLLVEGVRDYAIFMLDTEGYITTWNAGAERFKGYKAKEIIGQHFSRFYTEEDIARRHPWAELEIAAREGRYEEEGWRVRKNGSHFWTNVVITALRDDTGTLRGFAKVTRDITERRQRETEHANAQVVEQQRRFLKDVLASVTQGRLILCDLAGELPLLLSDEPEGGTIPLSRKALKMVRACVSNVAATTALPPDRTQDLITAASEGAMNAVQHAGGGTARVYGNSDTVQVWIEDSGGGIDLSHLPRATLESGYSTGGVGIGHGFSLMIACCQRVYLRTSTSGTTIVLEQTPLSIQPLWFQAG